jgi:isopenicillin-N epimerase
MALTFGRSMLSEWALDPAFTYLNHGTVGAPPRRVLEAQQKLRDEIERHPSRFLLRELTDVSLGCDQKTRPRLRLAADAVAAFLGVEGNDLVFVDNATTGINAVLHTFDFRPDDELLILDHAYGAIRNAAEHATRVRGARVRVVTMPDVTGGTEVLLPTIKQALTSHTRLVLIDHITSESALILPVAEIASLCHHHGVAVLVDGAHAPGAIPLDITSLGVDWYSGNLHKWAWSPRSSGVLWTHSSRQGGLHHPVVSWGQDQGFRREFDWPGTRDPTAHLAAPVGIQYMTELGILNVQRYNHELAWNAGNAMASHWKTGLLGPESAIGTMVSVLLPERLGSTPEEASRLRDALLFEDNIEVQIAAPRGRIYVRVSAQIYNDMNDVERLINSIDRRL